MRAESAGGKIIAAAAAVGPKIVRRAEPRDPAFVVGCVEFDARLLDFRGTDERREVPIAAGRIRLSAAIADEIPDQRARRRANRDLPKRVILVEVARE